MAPQQPTRAIGCHVLDVVVSIKPTNDELNWLGISTRPLTSIQTIEVPRKFSITLGACGVFYELIRGYDIFNRFYLVLIQGNRLFVCC